jgi:trimeric autotransporter adhesin
MVMAHRFVRVLACLWLLLVWIAPAGAQQFTGGVRGAVRDANGVVPGVAVTLTNEATNIAREVVTNDVGQYSFPAVPPGTYTVKVQLAGFKTFESKGIIVGTQQFITLDVTLEVGAIEENVTVTGQSPLIDTSTASTGGVLDKATLDALPAPGRNAFLIGITVPTFTPTGDPQFNGSRTSPTPRSSRWAAAVSAPTTTSSTACRSPNCAEERCSTRRSKRSKK